MLEDSSHVTIPSVDSIAHEFTIRSKFICFTTGIKAWQRALPYPILTPLAQLRVRRNENREASINMIWALGCTYQAINLQPFFYFVLLCYERIMAQSLLASLPVISHQAAAAPPSSYTRRVPESLLLLLKTSIQMN